VTGKPEAHGAARGTARIRLSGPRDHFAFELAAGELFLKGHGSILTKPSEDGRPSWRSFLARFMAGEWRCL
jgi:hypothetical protein